MDSMRRKPRKTPIGVVRDVLQVWAQSQGWKQGTMVANLIEAHYREGLDRITGITFSRDGDPARDMKTNTERVMRWLDDQTKDSTLLPFNFYLTVMAALPADLRQQLVLELHEEFGLTVAQVGDATAKQFSEVVHAMVKESGEAMTAVVGLIQKHAPDIDRAALTEIDEAMAALKDARLAVAAMLMGEG